MNNGIYLMKLELKLGATISNRNQREGRNGWKLAGSRGHGL
jgi:hypothetical protein